MIKIPFSFFSLIAALALIGCDDDREISRSEPPPPAPEPTPGQRLDRALEKTEKVRKEAGIVTGKALQKVGQGLEDAATHVQKEMEDERAKSNR